MTITLVVVSLTDKLYCDVCNEKSGRLKSDLGKLVCNNCYSLIRNEEQSIFDICQK